MKSNMGHSEATSGLCSLAKVVITLHNNLIPPNIHFVEPRGDVPALLEGRLKVVADTQELMGPMICVNSFGFGGGNAHALFKGNTKEKVNFGIPTDNAPRLVIWSGRTEEAVKTILDSVKNHQLDAEYVGLLHNIQTETFSANIYRGYGIFTQEGNEENAECVFQHMKRFDSAKRPIVWAYSGFGSQWSEMGADLMKNKIFAEAIENCHSILATRGIDLKEIIESPDPSVFDNILHSIVGIAAIQIGLTDIMKAVGIKPDYIIGHSIGELGCAYADGCFTAKEMILAAYAVGMTCLEAKVEHGAMATVGMGYKKLLTMIPEGVAIAHHNSAESCTISGPHESVSLFVEHLKRNNYYASEVQCSNIPFHSGYIAEMRQTLIKRFNEIIKRPRQRSTKWISTSVPATNQKSTEAHFSSSLYHANTLISSVFFEEACEKLPKNSLTIEIAPQRMLQGFFKTSLPCSQYVALIQHESKHNSIVVLNALGR